MSNIADKELDLMRKLINFGNSDTVSTVNNKPILEYHMKGADGNTYGIVRENNKFYIKIAPKKDTELMAEDYNYIGGINNKKEYEYSTYALASKQFDMKMMSLNEAHLSNKQTVVEMKSVDADWQINETKEMRAEIERFNQISRNVETILGEGDGFTTAHTLPEAPSKNPSEKEVNSPYTDTAVAKGDKDFKEKHTNHEKAGKPYDKDGKVSNDDMGSDKNERGEKGDVYTDKAQYVPDNSVADKKPNGGKVVKVNENKGRTFKLTHSQVLAWHDSPYYMDKSHGTEIGDSAPYTECASSDNGCNEGNTHKVNEGRYQNEPQTPQDVVEYMKTMRSNIFTLENGDYKYIDYDPERNVLIAGGATNSGIIPEYTQEYDFDYSFDQNLESLIDTVNENESVGIEESCDVMHNSVNQNCPSPGNGNIGDSSPYDDTVNEDDINVNDVAGMPDDYDDVPFPEVEDSYSDVMDDDFDYENFDDSEWGFDDDDDGIYNESKQDNGKVVSENIVLNDFGKHPAYQKAPMTTPPNKEIDKFGNDWNDASAKGEEPYGKQIGSNAPYTDKIVDIIADAIMKRFGSEKKKS